MEEDIGSRIKENLCRVLSDLADAERESGRDAGSVKLCAVSKFHSAGEVMAAIDAGQLLFGENRVQEACAKFADISARLAAAGSAQKPELHIIGSLQLNKVKKAVEAASCIQSVDREELLSEIEKRCAASGKTIKVFFEIHTGEESKAGYTDEKDLYASLENCAKGLYPHVIPSGLMTMAPFTDDEPLVRKSFSSLRLLRERLAKDFPSLPLVELSMGMSGDYRIAVQEGSTMVRIGTAIFGPRVM
ncbi:MAG: YggS family pyridoxal phosphate-dependent enzyme [Treponema sp.]|nr:YggS family pyridoxal phosphate-dependent enzyme [Treponema sp.]